MVAGVAHLAGLRTLRTLSMRECSRVDAHAGFAAFAAVAHPVRCVNLAGCYAFSQPGASPLAAGPGDHDSCMHCSSTETSFWPG